MDEFHRTTPPCQDAGPGLIMAYLAGRVKELAGSLYEYLTIYIVFIEKWLIQRPV
jgi:hypothetical protein